MSGRRFPKRVGGDLAGVIDAVGPGVRGLAVGDEVFGLTDGMKGGAYAEVVVTRAELLVQLMQFLRMAQGGGAHACRARGSSARLIRSMVRFSAT